MEPQRSGKRRRIVPRLISPSEIPNPTPAFQELGKEENKESNVTSQGMYLNVLGVQGITVDTSMPISWAFSRSNKIPSPLSSSPIGVRAVLENAIKQVGSACQYYEFPSQQGSSVFPPTPSTPTVGRGRFIDDWHSKAWNTWRQSFRSVVDNFLSGTIMNFSAMSKKAELRVIGLRFSPSSKDQDQPSSIPVLLFTRISGALGSRFKAEGVPVIDLDSTHLETQTHWSDVVDELKALDGTGVKTRLFRDSSQSITVGSPGIAIGPYCIRLGAQAFMECLEETLGGGVGIPHIVADKMFVGGTMKRLTVSETRRVGGHGFEKAQRGFRAVLEAPVILPSTCQRLKAVLHQTMERLSVHAEGKHLDLLRIQPIHDPPTSMTSILIKLYRLFA